MKKPLLLFAIKCTVIVYCAAFTNIEKLTVSKAVTQQLVTKFNWKVNCYDNANTDNTCIFDGYAFAFNETGKVTATKNNITFEGNWLEDNFSKKITLHFKSINPALNQLNNSWSISSMNDTEITFENTTTPDKEKLYITAL
jgi:hypothetical protein